MLLNYLSVCSGIEAATVAWHPLGWSPVAFAEIEPFPCRVLRHHYPTVPNLGDMTKFKDWPDAAVDVLVGGTPCQSFSIAGLRKGLDDPRGNLMLTYGAIAAKYRPKWLVWENVPGVLSSNSGRDFGAFLGMLGQLGYGFAYRVLDAQFFGVAQRRRRVFVVGCLGDLRAAAAVLLERQGLRGDSAPRRETRENPAGTLDASIGRRRGSGMNPNQLTHSLRGEGFDASEDGSGRGTPIVAMPLLAGGHANNPLDETLISTICMAHGQGGAEVNTDGGAPTLTCNHEAPILAFDCKAGGNTGFAVGELVGALRGEGHGGGHSAISIKHAVRRLTPRECERLQGFPDDYTNIPGAKDGPRYKALGNSMAVPVMAWIGQRLAFVDTIATRSAA